MGKHSATSDQPDVPEGTDMPEGTDGPEGTDALGSDEQDGRPRRSTAPVAEDEGVRSARQKRRATRRRRILAGCGIGLLIVIAALAVAGFAYIRNVDRRIEQRTAEIDPQLTETLVERPEEPSDPFYMLLLGSDVRPGETQARADTIILARLDPAEKKVTLLSIPRDTRVEIPGYGTNKINAASFLGGPSLMVETVSEFTGLPISHYAEVDFDGFKEVVDTMGGVQVDVPMDIYDPLAANYDASAYSVDAGPQTLDGKHALTFVRSRNFPDGDFTRMQNQQLFLRAVLKQMLSLSSALKVTQIVDSTVSHVTTDLGITEIAGLANDFWGMDLGDLETVTVPGEARMIGGGSYVIVDEEAMAELIAELEGGAPSDGSIDTPTVIASPSQVSVTVRNGSGESGVAADAARVLTRYGFRVDSIGDMGSFGYDETLVVYDEGEAEAATVAEHLGIGELTESGGRFSFGTDVLVVVGRDFDELRGPTTGQLLQY
jgi:LCP family protein required for cell wall assembly